MLRIIRYLAVVSSICLISLQVCAQVLVVEVQPVPAAGEPEWVELVNTSATSISLREWTLCDPRGCSDLPDVVILPGRLCVLTRDSAALVEQRHIPDSVAVHSAALPSLNNTTDTLMLLHRSVLIDRMSYTVRSVDRGRSIERRGSERDGRVAWDSAWEVTTAFDSATCGRINSAVRSEMDYRLRAMRVLRDRVAIHVANDGTRAGGPRRVVCGCDDVVFDTVVGPLRVGEEVIWLVPEGCVQGHERVAFRTVHARIEGADDRPENDVITTRITIPPVAGMVMINEVLAQPRTGECDLVEIWNGTSDSVDLADWVIETTRGVQYRCVAPLVVPPSGFGVLCASMSAASMQTVVPRARTSPTLAIQQERELVVLCTPEGLRVDSMWYDRSYHHPRIGSIDGVSLEKRSEHMRSEQSAAWTSSAAPARSTPGARNSVARDASSSATLAAYPSVISSDPMHGQSTAQIVWQIPFVQARARIDIYDEAGFVRHTLCNSCFIAAEGRYAWDGTDSAGRRVEPGPYIASILAVDANTADVARGRCVVIVAE